MYYVSLTFLVSFSVQADSSFEFKKIKLEIYNVFLNLNIPCLRNEKSSILPYLVLWFWGILLNPRQIKGSKEMITSIYTKLFVLFYHLFFLLDNGSFQDSCTNNSCWIFFLSVIYQTLQIHNYVYIGFNVHEQLVFFNTVTKAATSEHNNCV